MKHLEYGVDLASAAEKLGLDLNDIIAQIPGHVYWVDKNNISYGFNTAAWEDFNYKSPFDLLHKPCYQIFSKEEEQKLIAVNNQVMEEGVCLAGEDPDVSPDGRKRHYLYNKAPLRNKQGKIVGLIGMSIDVTKARESEIKALQEINKEKLEFIMNMGHDLRTPMTGVLGLAKAISQENNIETIKTYAQLIINSSNQVLMFANRWIHANETLQEAKKTIETFNFKELVENIVAMFTSIAKQKEVNIIVNYDEKLPSIVTSSMDTLYKIIINLLGNAVKFMHQPGTINIIAKLEKLEVAEEKHTKAKISLSIADMGPGIAKKNQGRIFDKFKKISASYRGQYQGAGLGLSIVKSMLNELGGTITLCSRLGKGSTFCCYFEVIVPPEEDIVHLTNTSRTVKKEDYAYFNETITQADSINFNLEKQQNLQGKHFKILLVEDNDVAALATKLLFENTMKHLQVDCVKSGKSALEVLNVTHYNLIILDQGLPDMDGIEVLKMIRKLKDKVKASIPIVALTGHATAHIRQKLIIEGAQIVLVKPLRRQQIKLILEGYGLLYHSNQF